MSNVIIPLVTTFDQYDLRAKPAFLDMTEQVGPMFTGLMSKAVVVNLGGPYSSLEGWVW